MTYTKATTASFSQRIAGLLSALIIGLLLSACQMSVVRVRGAAWCVMSVSVLCAVLVPMRVWGLLAA